MNHLPFLVCMLALAGSFQAQGKLLTVDDSGGPGVAFTDLQAAIDAAVDGDTLLIRAGNYGSVSISGKALVLVGDSTSPASEHKLQSALIANLSPAQSCVLRHLSLAGFSLAALRVQSCAGAVLVEDCTLASYGTEALSIAGAQAFTLVRSHVQALGSGGSGMLVQASSTYLYDSILLGAPGANAGQAPPPFTGVCFPPGTGGPALRQLGGFAYASGCTLTGGKGGAGWWSQTCQVYCAGGKGGAGADVGNASILRLRATAPGGGPPGGGAFDFTYFVTCYAGDPGPDISASPGADVQSVPGSARSLEVNAPVGEGQTVVLTFRGQALDLAFLLLAAGHSPFYVPACGGSLSPSLPLLVAFMGVLPATGQLSVPIPIGSLEPLLQVAALHTQANFIPADGTCNVGAPSAAVLRDCGTSFGAPDCNSNGRADDCDITSGATSDCDANWIPDACEVASGSQPDCNANGVPDSCDIASGVSTDCNANAIPDACEIASGSQPDCNVNGWPDACDIAGGASSDFNGNGLPDECEPPFSLVRWVDDDAASDPGPGDPLLSDPLEDGSQQHPYDSIQEAISASVAGDTVRARSGTYTGAGNRDISPQGKAIRIESESGSASTTIDCQSAGRAFALTSFEKHDTRIAGFLIRSGKAGFPLSGSHDGGGILLAGAGPTIEACVFVDCSADGDGAGLCAQSYAVYGPPIVRDCEFRSNTAGGEGGGVYFNGPGVVEDSSFIQNRSLGDFVSLGGGGARVGQGSVFTRCSFEGNTSDTSGGALSALPPLTLIDCEMAGNSAYSKGGGLYLSGTLPPASGPSKIRSCLFTANQSVGDGAAVHAGAVLTTLAGCTLVGNAAQGRGGGLALSGSSQVSLTSSLVWGNSGAFSGPGSGAQIALLASPCQLGVDWCDVQGGSADVSVSGSGLGWSAANIALDPLLGGPGVVAYHLSAGSPCRDAGDPAYAPVVGETDVDGEPRIKNGRVDMGADEL